MIANKAKILLVEDDASLGFVIKDNLEINGFHVTLCGDGEAAWQTFRQAAFDLCILDVMLPKRDGFTLAQYIRQYNTLVPIIFLTAKSMKEDKIAGFKTGGDDYITKPFSIEELLLRIEVFLKRSQYTVSQAIPIPVFSIGKYTFDYKNLLLSYGTEKRYLTQKEADILQLFCLNPDVTLKREDILNKVWGDDDYFMGRSLDVFITKLRKYLKADSNIEIVNLHGVGFKLEVK
ncbi:response regulator transcription factor [Rhodocytophaga rosea]|uniref:Response regulator transcription factor n=1 Tax=Rhodocytophaga rosea TaxID=2704465 RepID=A0A6C0GHE3_9BACT|nr:response regulator transcription factor [Rhodocytophaga rosea]QHT67133.1 response regulator transcription factor [Rhodocytophaga rosea]